MSEQPAQSAPTPSAPTQVPAAPVPAAPVPGDPQAAAEHAIQAAVDRLDAARAGSLDDQLAAAEVVHETLNTHLSGSPAAQRGPR